MTAGPVSEETTITLSDGRTMTMIACHKVSGRMSPTACAKMHLAEKTPTCAQCADGRRRALEQGLVTLRSATKAHRLKKRRCKEKGCRRVFETYDGREHYCPGCATVKARLKQPTMESCAILVGCGYSGKLLKTKNGSVLITDAPESMIARVRAVLMHAGYVVIEDKVPVGTAVHAVDPESKPRARRVRVRRVPGYRTGVGE